MSKLSFTIGLPRAGKDTFCSKWKNEKEGRIVLSGDTFRLCIYNQRFSNIGEELVRASLITAARALIFDGYEVMINDTNTSITSILQIINIDPDAKAYIFTTPIDECIIRAKKTNQSDLVEPIRRLHKNLEITLRAIEEGFLILNNIEEIK